MYTLSNELYPFQYPYYNDYYTFRNQFPQEFPPLEYDSDDERFFPLIPFVAGLVVGPLLLTPFLLNRPYYPPYYPPYPSYPPMYTVPGGQMFSPNVVSQGFNPNYSGVTENINIYTK
ncbi:MAG: hypothetical protein ACI35P_09800 [Bacillus sp. (in: firmicutes)]